VVTGEHGVRESSRADIEGQKKFNRRQEDQKPALDLSSWLARNKI
jgi:hypothetical protein